MIVVSFATHFTAFRFGKFHPYDCDRGQYSQYEKGMVIKIIQSINTIRGNWHLGRNES